uniref:Serine/threonine protein kinase n=1 Tax=Hydatigena taeniaeformis TaxID=6205 RepID=A0A0R3XDF2_HYDTA
LAWRSDEGPATGWGVSETGIAPIDKSDTVAAVASVVGCCCG